MKIFTPEISWHQKEPIFSVDFCPSTWKLASCGADTTIKIWLVKEKDESIGLDFLSNLDRHCKPVNVVRFSPNGKLLASASDEGAIILWKLNENDKSASSGIFGDEDICNKESWNVYKMLRGHVEDVYDLAWSPDSNQLITGSVDNSSIIWDAVKGQNVRILTDHKHYVQGVCWDPRNFYVATHSSDRSCRLYSLHNYKCCQNIHKNNSSIKKNGELVKCKLPRMFLDETMQSFFRRCTFSPDGSFLFLPAGICDGDPKPKRTTYVFARGHYGRPIKHLPGTKKPTVCVKCSPVVYELLEDKGNCGAHLKENNTYFKVPYRMVYAVASLDAITFYDTQHDLPIAHCANLHYASLTDIAWSSDGKLVVISSTDGYCSFVRFDDGELGTPITFDPIEYQVTQAKIRKAQKKGSSKKEVKKKEEPKKADLKKSDIESDKKEQIKKPVVTPVRIDEPKDKIPKLDRNQLTIEKLFITPVRKRKRLSETSPKSPTDIESPKPSNSDKSTVATKKEIAPPSTPKSGSGVKPAKRIQVITLSPSGAVKPPKRVNVTTLKSFSSDNNTDVKKQISPFKDNTTPVLAKPPNDIQTSSKPPKRVSVTTLRSFTDDDDNKVDTPPVFSELPHLQEASKPTLTKETLMNESANKPPSSLVASVQASSLVTSVKKAKRVQVTTLKTFDDQPSTAVEQSKALEDDTNVIKTKSTEPIVID